MKETTLSDTEGFTAEENDMISDALKVEETDKTPTEEDGEQPVQPGEVFE